ncbi:MAG: ribonuclease HII [Candidatus Omnitrophica bacterium]|nr:ribonuclease HII [Candidatus Omnitrophota bacterium]
MPKISATDSELGRVEALFHFDATHSGHGCLVGIDEAGRGPWAGPVVAAAVSFPPELDPGLLRLLDDSKKLTPVKREKLADQIMEHAFAYGIGQASPQEIDRLDIEKATFLAMKRALLDSALLPDRLLVDGHRDPGLGVPTECIVKGDGASACIAAASILAKTARDRQMTILGGEEDLWGFAKHKGYGTKFHQHALAVFGVTEHHRKTFKPVARCLDNASPSETFLGIHRSLNRVEDVADLEDLERAVDRQITFLQTSELWLLREKVSERRKDLSKQSGGRNLREKGSKYEEVVDRFLVQRGYNILERNYHGARGEIDLIARDGETLVFIEVKMRRGGDYGSGIEAIDPRKMNRVATTALEYLSLLDREENCRFDVVTVEKEELGSVHIEHYPNAFTPGEDFLL